MHVEMHVGQLLYSIFNGFVDCYVQNLNVAGAARGDKGRGNIQLSKSISNLQISQLINCYLIRLKAYLVGFLSSEYV